MTVKPQPRRLATSSALLIILSFSELTLGLVNRSIYASMFGASREMDIFLLVIGLVSWLGTVITLSTRKALVPSFIAIREQEGPEAAWYMASTIINVLILGIVLLCIVGWLFAEPLTSILGAGLKREELGLASNLFRLALPSIGLTLLISLFSALLFSYEDFVFPKLIQVVAYPLLIASIVLFGPQIGIYSMAMGIIIQTLSTSICLFFRIRSKQLAYDPTYINLRDPRLVDFGKVASPLLAHSTFSKISPVVDRFFASFLATGSITYLNFAFSIIVLPQTILTTGLQVILPSFSKLVANNEYDKVRDKASQGVALVYFLMIPALVGLVVLAKPIVMVLFESGEFNANSTERTAALIPFYFGLLIFAAPLNVLVSVVYATQKTTIVMYIGLVDVIFNVLFNALFVALIGYRGIALSSTMIYLIDGILFVILTQRIIGKLYWHIIGRSIAISGVSAAVLAVVIWTLQETTFTISSSEHLRIMNIIQLIVLVGIGASVYFVVAILLRSAEGIYLMDWAIGAFRNFVRRQAPVAIE